MGVRAMREENVFYASGAAVLFGNSGGVMEAAVRTVYEVLSGKELPAVKLDAVRGLKGVKAATLALPLQGGFV
jgi:iron only hydrogenase large subunit-like protein